MDPITICRVLKTTSMGITGWLQCRLLPSNIAAGSNSVSWSESDGQTKWKAYNFSLGPGSWFIAAHWRRCKSSVGNFKDDHYGPFAGSLALLRRTAIGYSFDSRRKWSWLGCGLRQVWLSFLGKRAGIVLIDAFLAQSIAIQRWLVSRAGLHYLSIHNRTWLNT